MIRYVKIKILFYYKKSYNKSEVKTVVRVMNNLLRNKLKEIVDSLHEEELTEVINFIEYLKFKEEKEENEILNDVELMESIKRGLKDIENGDVYDFEDVFE
ncbi:hypothetical protein Calhy_0489 [Caldicellulosiruptor hydrothermalis 108]|uniref:DUF2281 domain-containing protein n=1 Tax=Caldicellulosiruptor hydrothermalis (strain DSM 18901 / VKM B-2411 / 108) TaxID=632292 RepID=E4QCD7_CALH1|nr:hypothetical protein Calhy_0489 [Caldicellulosiruptor hydrothermalis 108]